MCEMENSLSKLNEFLGESLINADLIFIAGKNFISSLQLRFDIQP